MQCLLSTSIHVIFIIARVTENFQGSVQLFAFPCQRGHSQSGEPPPPHCVQVYNSTVLSGTSASHSDVPFRFWRAMDPMMHDSQHARPRYGRRNTCPHSVYYNNIINTHPCLYRSRMSESAELPWHDRDRSVY